MLLSCAKLTRVCMPCVPRIRRVSNFFFDAVFRIIFELNGIDFGRQVALAVSPHCTSGAEIAFCCTGGHAERVPREVGITFKSLLSASGVAPGPHLKVLFGS